MKISSAFSLLFSIALLCFTTGIYAQTQGIKWSQCYGDSGYDAFQSVKLTADGGFIAIGSTNSNGSLVVSRHPLSEVYVVKTDSNGKQQWYNTYGGSADDFGYDIVQTPDGGYMFVGGTYSNDGDVSGNHGLEDMWVVKIDSIGNIQGQHCFGGSSTDEAHSISSAPDGNYFVAGFTSSGDGDINQSFGGADFCVFKITLSGNIIWQQSYGGSGDDIANAVIATADTGCLIAGSTVSIDGEVTGNNYSEDFWVVKADIYGNLQHEQCFGGPGTDFATGVTLTGNNNYLVCGSDNADGGDVTGNNGGQDFWVIKVNDTLGLVWEKSLGGDSNDVATGIVPGINGSCYVGGYTLSNNDNVSGNHGEYDGWVIQLDSSANLLWQECVGDTGEDFCYSVCTAANGDVIVGGTTNSNAGMMSTNHGSYDGFITRLSVSASGIAAPSIHAVATVYPNPTSNYLTVQLYNTTIIKSIQLQLLDVTGRVLVEEQGQLASSYYYNQLDVSSMTAGIYFLNIRINNIGYLVQKIVKD